MSDQVPVAADTFAATLSERHLRCRELGHVWRSQTVSYDRGEGVYDRALRCSSCRTIRRQILSSSGAVLRNRYEYADGYLANHVEPGFSRDVFRLEAVVRALGSTKPKGGR